MTERKGFTMIELMVVVAIISILLTILAPALTSIVRMAKTAVCSSRLETIGKAATAYAGSNEQQLPYRADGSTYLTYMGYKYNMELSATTKCYSNSRPWYLLVVHGMAPPSTFVCPADADADGMISDPGYYDFGTGGGQPRPLSYSLQAVLSAQTSSGGYTGAANQCKPMTLMHKGGVAIGADRTGLGEWQYASSYWKQEPSGISVNVNQVEMGNSMNHDQRGQNVLYLGAHVKFQRGTWVGYEDDNIYARRGSSGGGSGFKTERPADAEDSVLK